MKTYLARRLVGVSDAIFNCHYATFESDLPPEKREMVKTNLLFLAKEMDALGLPLSKVFSERMLAGLDVGTCDSITDELEVLKSRFDDEIRNISFLYIPGDRAAYYNQSNPFGAAASKAFPSAEYDMQEASNCFATGRFTACIYHSMRVLEHGLCALAARFKVPFEHRTWNDIIEPIEKAIRDIKKSPKKPKNWKRDEQFFSEAAAQFMHVKNAWRNYTAHKQFHYGEEQAETVFRHVREFVAHLATRLSEKKRR